MDSNKNIIFLGMMGSGKSSIGSLVSKKLKLPFIDIDNLIEESLRMSITEIFENKGEDYFRKLEEKITLKSLKNKKNVIALGGGGFLNNNIRKKILKNHISFWLNWKNLTILKRIRGSKKRPIIEKLNNDEINKLIIDRNSIYAKADNKIDCENKTKNEIAELIKKIYEKL